MMPSTSLFRWCTKRIAFHWTSSTSPATSMHSSTWPVTYFLTTARTSPLPSHSPSWLRSHMWRGHGGMSPKGAPLLSSSVQQNPTVSWFTALAHTGRLTSSPLKSWRSTSTSHLILELVPPRSRPLHPRSAMVSRTTFCSSSIVPVLPSWWTNAPSNCTSEETTPSCPSQSPWWLEE